MATNTRKQGSKAKGNESQEIQHIPEDEAAPVISPCVNRDAATIELTGRVLVGKRLTVDKEGRLRPSSP